LRFLKRLSAGASAAQVAALEGAMAADLKAAVPSAKWLTAMPEGR